MMQTYDDFGWQSCLQRRTAVFHRPVSAIGLLTSRFTATQDVSTRAVNMPQSDISVIVPNIHGTSRICQRIWVSSQVLRWVTPFCTNSPSLEYKVDHSASLLAIKRLPLNRIQEACSPCPRQWFLSWLCLSAWCNRTDSPAGVYQALRSSWRWRLYISVRHPDCVLLNVLPVAFSCKIDLGDNEVFGGVMATMWAFDWCFHLMRWVFAAASGMTWSISFMKSKNGSMKHDEWINYEAPRTT